MTAEQIERNKEQISALIMSTDTDGKENLLQCMSSGGFFTAPCSSQYHLSEEGGLAQHSLNVYRTMLSVSNALLGVEETNKIHDSIILCSLLHDLGKMGDHAKVNYVPNMVRSRKKNPETGDYDRIQSESKPYETNKELLYVDHAVRSIVIARQFIWLTEEEEHAILYHNGKYTHIGYDLKETPLQMLLHFSDLWCGKWTELEDNLKIAGE